MISAARRSYKELSLAQLRSFCEICRLGRYTAAAQSRLLTVPAIWEQMQGLERYYGVSLLARHGNGVRPTAAGGELLELVRPLLAGLDSAREVLRQRQVAPPQRLVLATNLRVLTEEISRGLRMFQALQPGVRLGVVYTGNDVEQRILDGAADVGLTLEPGPDDPRPAAAIYEPVGEVDYLLVTPPRHPLLRRRTLQLRHIVAYPLVLGESVAYSRHRVQEALHRHALQGNIALAVETSSDEYTLSCVRAGLGVGITIGTGQGHLYRGLGVRSLRRWFGTARVGFLWKKGAHVPPGQRALANAVRAALTGGRTPRNNTQQP
jgi:DNA-binding transcriptional LysR family regulator